MDRERVERLRNGLPGRLNTGILMGDGGFCVLGWVLFSSASTRSACTATHSRSSTRHAADLRSKSWRGEYGLGREQVLDLARLNDATPASHPASMQCGPGSTSCSPRLGRDDVDGGELVAARDSRSHGVTHLFGLGGGHINPTGGRRPARHSHHRRTSRGGRDALRRGLVARDREARRRARHRRSGPHERAHGHRDRARAAQPDARDRWCRDEPGA